jgi:hypothetical protein
MNLRLFSCRRSGWKVASLSLFLMLGFRPDCTYGAIGINGSASVWAYMNDDSIEHVHVVPVLSFTLKDPANPTWRFETSLRGYSDVRHHTSYDRELKVLRGVLIYTPQNSKWELRLGQQWLQEGVGRGNVAGVWARYKVDAHTSAAVYGGARLANTLDLEHKNDNEGIAAGFQARTRLEPLNCSASYFYVAKHGDLLYHAAGLEANGRFGYGLAGRARFEMNLGQTSVERAQILGEWQARSNVLVSAEFRSQQPRVYEDSFFTIFLSEASTEYVRASARWNFYKFFYVRGTGSTLMSENPDPLYKVQGALGCRHIEAGYTHWVSVAKGEMDGIFAQGNWAYRDFLRAYAGYDFSKGSNADTQPDGESHAAYLGATVTPCSPIDFTARVEQVSDLRYKNDWRGLLGLTLRYDSQCWASGCGSCCGGAR